MSIVILNASSIILGSMFYRSREDYSREGFVFTYISQGLHSSSIIKSYPNNSKHHCLEILFSFLLILIADKRTIFFISSTSNHHYLLFPMGFFHILKLATLNAERIIDYLLQTFHSPCNAFELRYSLGAH